MKSLWLEWGMGIQSELDTTRPGKALLSYRAAFIDGSSRLEQGTSGLMFDWVDGSVEHTKLVGWWWWWWWL